MLATVPQSGWPAALGRYLAASAAFHLTWEVLQLPLYTLWTTATVPQMMFAVGHCTLGDAMIAATSMILALALFGRPSWPDRGTRSVWLAVLAAGVGYAIYSEWLNVAVRGSWAYSDLMPIVPGLGTGLAPLLQWLVVPTLALAIAIGRAPWHEKAGGNVTERGRRRR